MSVFVNEAPTGAREAMTQLSAVAAPVVVVLIVQEGCGACEQYHPIFMAAAAPYAKAGLPFVQVDAADPEPEAQTWMATMGVTATPTVLVVKRYRGIIAKLEGVSSPVETRRAFDTALANNRRDQPW